MGDVGNTKTLYAIFGGLSPYFAGMDKKIMVISNDSLSPDAGSIVFYACLMQVTDEYQYRDFIRNYSLPKFISWIKSRDLLSRIFSLDNLFITDALIQIYINMNRGPTTQ